jgi:repressor of nif and glnA expression
MQERIERTRVVMLRVLQEADGPLGSDVITRNLKRLGVEMSERTTRYHLLALDK